MERQTIQHRREIIEAAQGAALARTQGNEELAKTHLTIAAKWFKRQSVRESLARQLFRDEYTREWNSLHPTTRSMTTHKER